MLTIRNISIPYEIFGYILHFVDNKDLGRIALVCKEAFEATISFINSQSKSPAKAEKIEPENLFTNSTSYKTMMRWQQAYKAKEQQDFEEACKQHPKLKEKTTKQIEGLVNSVLPMTVELLDNFENLGKKSDEFPVNFLDIFFQSVFKILPALNQTLEPTEPPLDQEITGIAYNMMSNAMRDMAKPENLTKLFESATAFAKSDFDENTLIGEGLLPVIRPVFEMFHPIMAKHMETLGILSTDEEMHQMFDVIKKQLNEEYGSLKDYLQKTKKLDEILDEALIKHRIEPDILKIVDPKHPLANYQMDIFNPKTDYEKGLAIHFSNFPDSLQEEIQPILSKIGGLVYMAAGCQSPEEFQERTEKLFILKDKAAEQIGRIQLLKHHREQMIAIITAQPEFDLKNLDKVNQLFDIMEKDEDIEKSFNSIYQKAMRHQLKLLQSRLNFDNMEEELTGDIFDPLFCAKAVHLSMQKLLNQMSIYWNNLTQNVLDPSLRLQYEVAGFELQAMVPSSFRCGIHDKYERDLAAAQARGPKLLESGESIKQNNPIELSSFDRTLWNYYVSSNDMKEQINLLKMIPQIDEETMIETLVKQTNDNHRSMIKAFTNEVIIEEMNN